jgi:hypothetical protein
MSQSGAAAVYCPAIRWDSSPVAYDVRDGTAWEVDPSQLGPGPYAISIASGPEVLARIEFSMVAVPTVGGEVRWIPDPVRGSRVAYATGDGWIAWLPIDARFRGAHELTIAWYHDGRRVSERQAPIESRFASWGGDGYDLDAPVLELLPVHLGDVPDTTANIGTYTAVAILDHTIVAGSWSVEIGSGPIVEARGFTGMQYSVEPVEAFIPAFPQPGSFWAEIPPSEIDPAIAADAMAIAPRGEAAPQMEREPLVCAMAGEPQARAVFAELGELRRLRRGYDYRHAPRGDAMEERQWSRLDQLARRYRRGCLRELLGPELGALLY